MNLNVFISLKDFNFITALPGLEIHENLRSLSINGNQLRIISFNSFPALESLHINNNQLEKVEINSSRVKDLDLSANQLGDLDFLKNVSSIENLKLRKIFVSYIGGAPLPIALYKLIKARIY